MDGLKQRIIGALVLISLAVIFVPMIFDEPHSERTSTSINIPEEPPFPEVDTPDSDLPAPPSYQQSGQSEVGRGNSAPQDFRIVEDSASSAAPEKPQANTGTSPDPEPSPSTPPAPDPSPAASAAPEPSPVQAKAPEKSEPAADPEPAPGEFTRSLEGAWVVQLGSFGNSDNARRLRDKVREKGYNSHLQEVVRGEKTLTRVFSGPFAEKSKAQAAKRALDKAFSLNSLVTSGDK